MMSLVSRRWLNVAALLFAVVVVAGCARTPANTVAGAATPGSPQDFSVNVGDRVFFTVDSSTISPQAAGVLNRQAEWLNKYPRYAITMEGHADERGTREYNIALSARRANAAKNYLVSRGVPGNRIKTISFGKERPVATCDDVSCWSQNRRAVTVLASR
ncbi:MAG: peptidoglycan-associated lipoprotein Pal [Devosia sp.]